jgi:valyl-tRNA synthetase
MEAQRRRLEKENDQLTKNIASLEKQLSDDSFLSRAPEPVVANMRTKLSDYQAQLAKNKAALESLE